MSVFKGLLLVEFDSISTGTSLNQLLRLALHTDTEKVEPVFLYSFIFSPDLTYYNQFK